ncbi:helix-turn-helix domain-containing protein [Chryseobacterium sediminis]|uniref:AraC family transcriptional regulator n=1 Tax=Chryseobacterium sediminis TaxID=1679494 RepID=A0A5B2UDP9_9FLAO|nr:helix-turn-helix domain-containing protein [Chryseobacterium sediminis]KAA2224295.1 AraC family transcriptional regulator [Chryseobacterium sediminis]
MNWCFNIFDTVVITAVIQGVATTIAIGYSPSHTSGKKLLSAILITLAFLNIKILLHTLGLWQYPGFHYFPLAIDTLMQPLFYLYTCSLTEKHFSLNRKHWLHFLPALIFQFHAMIVYIIGFIQPDVQTQDFIAEKYLYYNSVKWAEDFFVLVSAGIYWYLSFRKTQKYRRWLFTSQSATQYQELAWLRNLLIGTGILVIVLFLSSITSNILQLNHSFLYLEIFYGYLALLIYFLSFQGYRTIIAGEVQSVRISKNKIYTEEIPQPEITSMDIKTSLDEKNLYAIQSALLEIMEKQHLFIEPELNLKDVAKIIGFPASQVSAAINAKFEMNFRSWVNSYRVEEVKKRLNNPEYKHLSLTGIAFDCGFNSEASFYRIFRKHTGHSPKTYSKSTK